MTAEDDAQLVRAARANFGRWISRGDAPTPEGGGRERIASGLYMVSKRGGLEHAANFPEFLAAIRQAKNSDETASAHRPEVPCGEIAFVDQFEPPRVWVPGEKACPACVKALLAP